MPWENNFPMALNLIYQIHRSVLLNEFLLLKDMKSDLSSSFKSPHFKKLLTQYEEMIRQHTTIYFEGNELTLLAE